MGTLGLGRNLFGNPTAEIGYLLASRYERKCIIRSLAVMIGASIAKVRVRRIQIRCVTANHRTREVPGRFPDPKVRSAWAPLIGASWRR